MNESPSLSDAWLYLCKTVQSIRQVAGMDNVKTQLEDGIQVGAAINIGPDGDGATPASGLQIM